MLKEKLITYFKSGEKEQEKFLIGTELAHIILRKGDLKAVPFKGPQGVESLLAELTQKGWDGVKEGEHLITLKQNSITIRLGAGSQLILSIANAKNIREIDKIYLKFLKDIFPLLEDRQQLMLTIGYQPASRTEDIQLNPQKKYAFINEYFSDQNIYARQLLKSTASTKVTFDYAHLDDFRKKMHIAYALSPVMAALFDNSPIYEGKVYEEKCLRKFIYNNCDDERFYISDIYKNNYNYDDYADFLLKCILKTSKSQQELCKDQDFDNTLIEKITDTVFSEIQLKKTIEINMVDALPYPLNMAYIALWKGLLYNQDNLYALDEFTKTITSEDIAQANNDILKEGLNAKFGQGTILDLAKDLFFMAGNPTSNNEVHYLQPLEAIIFKEISPREVTLRHLQEFGK
ncbi:MAG: glutamate-cysteine ligase family protein [Peptococcales bacterium]